MRLVYDLVKEEDRHVVQGLLKHKATLILTYQGCDGAQPGAIVNARIAGKEAVRYVVCWVAKPSHRHPLGDSRVGVAEVEIGGYRTGVVLRRLTDRGNVNEFLGIQSSTGISFFDVSAVKEAQSDSPAVRYEVTPGKRYLHKRTGGVYETLMLAKDERDESLKVVYKSLTRPDDPPWIRDAAEFFDGRFVEHKPLSEFRPLMLGGLEDEIDRVSDHE